METTYHIGHEIEKELRAQGKSARWLADEICLTPQAVYDIFKRNHIATDRLADIQRVLGRDFFKELSQLTNNGGILADEEDESVLLERFELLMPEDKLHVLKREAYEELIEEFVVTEHHKPLVIFTNDPYVKGSVERTADRELGIGQVFYLDLKREWGKNISDEDIISHVQDMPHPIVLVGCDACNYSFRFMVKLAQETGKKVFAYCLDNNHLTNYTNNLEYHDPMIKYFGAWNKQIHFAFVDDERQSYRQTRQLFLADWGEDILSFLKLFMPFMKHDEEKDKTVWEWLNDPEKLYKAYMKYIESKASGLYRLKDFLFMYLDDEVNIKQDGLRWTVSLPIDDLMVQSNQNVLMQMVPLQLSMWIDIDENGIKDYEDSPLH